MNSLNSNATVKTKTEPELKAGSVHSLEENISILKGLRLSGMAQALSDSKQDSSFCSLSLRRSEVIKDPLSVR